MVQLECPKVTHPLVSLTFGVHCGVPFPLHAGKGKCCMWLVNKVEIYFGKIGFVDCKMPQGKIPLVCICKKGCSGHINLQE